VQGSWTFAQRTTIGVGGPAARWIVATTTDALVRAVLDGDANGEQLLVLGGGSNLLVADEGFAGTVVEVATPGVEETLGTESVALTAQAGEAWDALVDRAVARGWSGIEALAGIPGLVGATPVQNVGAYGQDVSQVVTSVEALDRSTGKVVRLAHADCGFGYRTSSFKTEPDRWVVLSVTVSLGTDPFGVVQYAELARELGVAIGDRVGVDRIRGAVLELRRRKAMVLDAADADTRSLGSFFMNPVVDEATSARIAAECPRYPADGGVKLSAAWLIEGSGVERGFHLPGSDARVSTKHTLALVNAGDARTEDVLALAREVQRRVRDRFGITLQPEPRLVGCRL
jgi:UDP-N-acetylmuramate dehydrogenase